MHLWSISVEEQFYLLWPALVRGLTPRLIVWTCLGICVLALAATWTLAATGSSMRSIWYNSLPQSIFFAAGALLALHLGNRDQVPSAMRAIAAIVGGLLLWCGAAVLSDVTNGASSSVPPRLTLGYATVAAGCALLVWGFLHLPGKLLPQPLLYLGRISYGLYLFHVPVLVAVRMLHLPPSRLLHLHGMSMALGLTATIGLAALSYSLIEKPFLRLKGRLELVKKRTA